MMSSVHGKAGVAACRTGAVHGRRQSMARCGAEATCDGATGGAFLSVEGDEGLNWLHPTFGNTP